MTTSWIFRKTGWIVEILLKSQGLGMGALSKGHKITPGKQGNGDCSRWFVLRRGKGRPHTFLPISSVPVKQTLSYISKVSTTATLNVLWLRTADHEHGRTLGSEFLRNSTCGPQFQRVELHAELLNWCDLRSDSTATAFRLQWKCYFTKINPQ